MGGEPLDSVAFLVRSETRLEVLRTLDGRSLDRRALEDETGAPRSTLSRALSGLTERGWIRAENGTYTATDAGSIVLEWLDPLLETIEGLHVLGKRPETLPTDDLPFDVRQFSDARLVTADEFTPTAVFERGIQRLREADAVRSAARAVPPEHVRVLHERVTADDLTAAVVLDGEYLDAIEGSETSRLWSDITAAADVRRYEGHIPYHLTVLDDVVHLRFSATGEGRPRLVESENPTVREWAESTVAEFRADADPCGRELLV